MTKTSKARGPYKKRLSIFELDALVEARAGSPIFISDQKGERTLELWLKDMRFEQAIQVARGILGTPINQQEFQDCWARTKLSRAKKAADPPNTATFGGYRLRSRTALNRDSKQKPRPKKK